MGDKGFDSAMIMENRGFEYKDSMVGWGDREWRTDDYREQREPDIEPDTKEAGTD